MLKKKFGEILVEMGIVTKEQIDVALLEQKDSGERMAAEPRDRGSSVDSNASDGSANPPGVLRCGTLEKPHGKK